jgi:GH25 family lysozyme M1 (1,4-beta-N-acetylmuramidase)
VIRPDNDNPEQNPRNHSSTSEDSTRHSSHRAETPERARSAALRFDHALRSGVDRVRPHAQRAGEWARPHAERVQQQIQPQLQRAWAVLGPYLRWLQERLAPYVERTQRVLRGPQTTHGRGRPSRLRAMQAGGIAAAIGVVGLVVANVGGGQSSDQAVHNAANQGSVQTLSGPAQAPPQQSPNPTTGEITPKSSDDVQQAVQSAPAGPPAEGVDVSNHNGNVDWSQVANAGKKFAFVLASDGENFQNSQYQTQSSGAKDAGLLVGAYHFGRPSGDPIAQADHLLQTANYTNDGKTLPPVLDLEPNTKGDKCYGKDPGQLADWTKQFTDHVKQATGRDPIIYSSTGYWSSCMAGNDQFKQNPLWLASYGTSNPKVPQGFDKFSFWQHSATGSVPGINGQTDENMYQGSLEQLQAFAK